MKHETNTGIIRIGSLSGLDPDDKAVLSEVAVSSEEETRSGTFVLKNSSLLCSRSNQNGIEILPIANALRQYQWLREKYYWSLISAEESPLSREEALTKEPLGFFLRVKKGQKGRLPCQAALYMTGALGRQVLHNVIILEEGSELEFITGCISTQRDFPGEHLAISEIYIGKNAQLTNTMVHSWSSSVRVVPYSVTAVDAGGTYVNNYISLRPAGIMDSNPVTFLNGAGASAKYFSVILGSEDSMISLGGDVYLNAEGTSAELAHRAVCTGGKIIQKGLLIGKAECHAHVDCSGMLITPGKEGFIESIPGLRSHHEDARMSHEASIGKIAPRQVQYLMAHGLEEREAISMIVRGFLDADISGLGPELDRRISDIAELAGHE
ncbi:SufD family Fe-S cluster assembly protein [Marispirochaeta sp.]|uniref:SufD family Fe-S cluster assembly protein n=1 Tax=Marispirochaeta sp. TaxID=2038653 RepID=UPI0029C719B1|nr:SufD family Fe-S cluster assembly protein [Marispirochaeta sp.]